MIMTLKPYDDDPNHTKNTVSPQPLVSALILNATTMALTSPMSATPALATALILTQTLTNVTHTEASRQNPRLSLGIRLDLGLGLRVGYGLGLRPG